MSDPQIELKHHRATKPFLIAIDSDGCAFDAMEIKHKECFTPNHVKHWSLQPISKYVREAADFVNLYSKWRGINRFPALIKMFDLLAERKEVQERNVTMPDIPNVRRWVDTEEKLGNPALEAYCSEHNGAEHQDMHTLLTWSKAVNESITDMVHGVPPFPHVRESLARAHEQADLLVCSATPHEALSREWEEHQLAPYVFAIAGQEQGKKAEHIALASDGNYAPNHILMLGDAFGDMNAAKANNALFYPINPGHEAESWKRFNDEALDLFLNEQYAGDYEAKVIAQFKSLLPEIPPWEK